MLEREVWEQTVENRLTAVIAGLNQLGPAVQQLAEQVASAHPEVVAEPEPDSDPEEKRTSLSEKLEVAEGEIAWYREELEITQRRLQAAERKIYDLEQKLSPKPAIEPLPPTRTAGSAMRRALSE